MEKWVGLAGIKYHPLTGTYDPLKGFFVTSFCGPGRDRTYDQTVMSRPLFH